MLVSVALASAVKKISVEGYFSLMFLASSCFYPTRQLGETDSFHVIAPPPLSK